MAGLSLDPAAFALVCDRHANCSAAESRAGGQLQHPNQRPGVVALERGCCCLHPGCLATVQQWGDRCGRHEPSADA